MALSRKESFGVAILEASSCGIPVITSDVGGLPEVVISNETGILVKSEDISAAATAIKRLILNKEKRKEYGKNGRTYVLKNYDLKSTIKRIVDVYESVQHKYKTNHAL